MVVFSLKVRGFNWVIDLLSFPITAPYFKYRKTLPGVLENQINMSRAITCVLNLVYAMFFRNYFNGLEE